MLSDSERKVPLAMPIVIFFNWERLLSAIYVYRIEVVIVVKKKSMGMVAIIAMTLLSASLAAVLLGTVSAADQESSARIQAAITGYTIVGPKVSGTQYVDTVSTGQEINYNVSVGAGSTYSLNQLNIVWQLETDWNVTVNVTGPTLKWIYYYEADRQIKVTLTDKLNSSNTTSETISVGIVADLDEDGLPDLWERNHFGTTAVTDDPTTTDYDGDGWTDLEEYDNETDPTTVNAKPGFIEQYSWLIALIAIVIVVLLLVIFVLMPKMKTKRQEDEKKKIAAAVEVEKSLLGLDELEEKPKK